jgi:cytoskeletal protein CcmA (bactofilin family)
MENDLIINGSGTTDGGRFQRVSINGKGTVSGEIECETFDCNGWGRFQSNVIARSMVINGFAEIYCSLDAAKIVINGRSRIHGDTAVRDIEVSGDGKIAGTLKGEKMTLHGRIAIGGDCEAESFRGGGQFKIDGLLNAEEVVIDLHGWSRAKEIGGKTVVVKRSENLGFFKIFEALFPFKLTVDTIEGDDIKIENTKANIVTGNKVSIGKGCRIGTVEYKDSYNQENGATVKEKRKL